MKTEDLVIVGSFVNAFDADAAAGALEAAGIDVVEKRDDCGGMRPQLWLSGVKLVVHAEDEERALDILRWASGGSAGEWMES